MPPRDPTAYLIDILSAIDEIEDATHGVTLDHYSGARAVRSRVEREFTILGEAVRQLLDAEPSVESQVTNAGRIIAFRNQLSHAYFAIQDATVWDIINTHVPLLKAEVRKLLQERSGPTT